MVMKYVYVHKHAQHISSGCGEGIFIFFKANTNWILSRTANTNHNSTKVF